jgi:uncharacterized Zn finger protein (UPF0148 family)
MAKHCQDCGTRLVEAGICPNCQEELYINDYQMAEEPVKVSPNWRATVDRQREELRQRKLRK